MNVPVIPPEEARHGPRFGATGAVIVALVGILITALASAWLHRVATDSGEQLFRQTTRQYRDQLDARFESMTTRLALARPLARDAGQMSQADWDRWFERNIRHDFVEIVGFGYGTAVIHRNGELEAATEADGRFPAMDGGNRMLPVTHLALGKAAPENAQFLRKGLGENLLSTKPGGSDPGESHATLEKSISSGQIRTTGVLDLSEPFTNHRSLPVIRLYLPVYRGMPGREDATNLAGVIFADVSLDATARNYFGDSAPDIGLSVLVQNQDGSWSELSGTDRMYPATARRPGAQFTSSDVQPLYSRPIRFDFWSTPAFERITHTRWPWISGGLGLAFTALVTGFLWIHGRARQSAAKIANELRQAHVRLAVATRERERLSRDLHDGTIQSIYALGLDLQRVRQLVDRHPDAARAEITRTLQALNNVVAELREFILQIEPGHHRHQNVDTVLHALVDRLRRNTKAEIALELDPSAAPLLPPRQVVEVLQIVREAVTNSLRHGHPDQIGIALSRDDDDWRLTIADDGSGFETHRVNGLSGHGLRNVNERAAELGGECQIVSAPGTGTAVRVVFPVLTNPPPAAEEMETT